MHQSHYLLYLLISFENFLSIYFSIISLNKRKPLFVLLMHNMVCVAVLCVYGVEGWIWNVSSIFLYYVKLTPFLDVSCFPKGGVIYLYNDYCGCSILILFIIFSLHLGWYAVYIETFDVPVDIIRECWRAKYRAFFIHNVSRYYTALNHGVVLEWHPHLHHSISFKTCHLNTIKPNI